MKRILYVPCYPGELGWELMNYIPHVNYVRRKDKIDEVHVVCRKGRESLYPFATQCYPIRLSDKGAVGNFGPSPQTPPKLLSKLNHIGRVNTILLPGRPMESYRLRKFFQYVPKHPYIDKWSSLPENSIVLTIRGRAHHANIKNWSAKKWIYLCKFILKRGYIPILTGKLETVIFDPPDGCINLMGKTNLGDLIAVMCKSKFVIGQSTGPAHLASLCGVPHAVWGPDRIKSRYVRTWNPFGTKVVYAKCGKGFDCPPRKVFSIFNELMENI